MKGIVFNLLERAVVDEHGDAAWDDLIDGSGATGAYTSLGSYPDEEMGALVTTACAALGVEPTTLLRWFGERALPQMRAAYPEFFAAHDRTIPFLLTLNDIIHPEVRKLYPGADVPDFDFAVPAPDVLVMTYHSARSLCAFAEGLIAGAAAEMGEAVAIHQPTCKLRGDDVCVIECRFTPATTARATTA